MYDVIIVGAGPAGMTAAIYVQRAGKKALVLEGKGFGGQIVNTPSIDNYPALPGVSGVQFAANLYQQMTDLGAEYKTEKVTAVRPTGDRLAVVTDSGVYDADAVILATGAKNRQLGVEGEVRLTGSGVSYCATCDGAFFRGRDVAVVGGGNTALEDAEVLAGMVNTVYLVHRRHEFRGDVATVQRLSALPNVEFVLGYVPESIDGKFMVEGLTLREKESGEERKLPVSGVFIAVGQAPENQDFENVASLDPAGYISAGENCETGTPGVFTAGDCRTKKVRQLTTAAADGAVAALAAVEYINGKKSG